MKIDLSRISSEDCELQSYGRRMADKLASEHDVETSLLNTERKRKLAHRLMYTGAGIAMCATLIGFLFAENSVLRITGPSLGAGVLVAALSALVASDLASLVRLHSPLSNEGHLCAALRALALHSPAVTEYIRSVTSTGRQLRIFDVTRANVVYESEQYRLTREQGEEACVALHSL